ncbi:hypothetical protein DFH29DRAFT_881157 [Suillus ampliporus]|nr:hypothetical protein DFH29DRAFT_881157 [Suillus ampliporus]
MNTPFEATTGGDGCGVWLGPDHGAVMRLEYRTYLRKEYDSPREAREPPWRVKSNVPHQNLEFWLKLENLEPSSILIEFHGHLVIADLVSRKRTTLCVRSAVPQSIWAGNYLGPNYIGFALDFWAVGVMLYEMLTRRTPWVTIKGLHVPDCIVAFEPFFVKVFHPHARHLLHNVRLNHTSEGYPKQAFIDRKKVEKRTLEITQTMSLMSRFQGRKMSPI